MGIKVYLSSFNLKVLLYYKSLYPDSELNVLLSFGTRSPDYYDMMFTHRSKINSLILDSGAFTKNFADKKTAEKITLEGFIAFCSDENIRNTFDFIFNYDEDFNMDGFGTNQQNMMRINEAGIDVVPVAHDYTGERVKEIEYYIKKHYPIIALGASEHKKKDALNNISIAVNKIVGAGLKVHLLGYTSMKVLGQLPIHYCDSSSWGQEGKFGNILWMNPYKGNTGDRVRFLDREDTADKWAYHIGNYPWRKPFEKYLKDQLGFSLKDVTGHDKDFNRQIANIHYFVQFQDEVRKQHLKNKIVIN